MRLKYANFIGHTEAFQELTDAPFALTTFQLGNMRVFFLTRHLPLKNIFEHVKNEHIVEMLSRMNVCLEALGVRLLSCTAALVRTSVQGTKG